MLPQGKCYHLLWIITAVIHTDTAQRSSPWRTSPVTLSHAPLIAVHSLSTVCPHSVTPPVYSWRFLFETLRRKSSTPLLQNHRVLPSSVVSIFTFPKTLVYSNTCTIPAKKKIELALLHSPVTILSRRDSTV